MKHHFYNGVGKVFDKICQETDSKGFTGNNIANHHKS